MRLVQRRIDFRAGHCNQISECALEKQPALIFLNWMFGVERRTFSGYFCYDDASCSTSS